VEQARAPARLDVRADGEKLLIVVTGGLRADDCALLQETMSAACADLVGASRIELDLRSVDVVTNDGLRALAGCVRLAHDLGADLRFRLGVGLATEIATRA
jgi:anti-anti-sigma regulatory factor